MDDLLRLYRYLVNNRHVTENFFPAPNDSNPYDTAYRALDSYLDIERQLSYYADKVHGKGGFEFDTAKELAEVLVTGFETGLNNHYGAALPTAINFMQKYLSSEEIDKLIDACRQEQKRMEREEDAEDEARQEEERLFMLDSGERSEDQ